MRVNLVRKSLDESIQCSELVENCFLSLEFPTSQAKSMNLEDVMAFFSLALPSFIFKIVSGPESVSLPPPKRQKYLLDGQEIPKMDWKVLLREIMESPKMGENTELGKRFFKRKWLLVAALKRKKGNVEEALLDLEKFSEKYPEKEIEYLKMIGIGGPEIREMEKNRVLEGMELELKLYALWSSATSSTVGLTGTEIENAINEAKSIGI